MDGVPSDAPDSGASPLANFHPSSSRACGGNFALMRHFRPLLVMALLLSVTLRSPAQSPTASSSPSPSSSSKPIAELNSADAAVKGAVIMTAAGTQVLSGSSVSAGDSPASLRLARGGQLRVCPHSVLSLSASASGNDLMLAMSTGSIETDYQLTSSADTIVTPDFRMVLAGPGLFHFAIGADSHGNTCVRALAGNASSLLVYEQMGDGVYQVHPRDQVTFRGGSVANPEMLASGECGCPAPRNVTAEVQPLGTTIGLPPKASQIPAAPSAPAPAVAAPPTVPPPSANEIHVQVDAPFVFRAAEVELPPAPVVARVRLQSLPAIPQAAAIPPVAPVAAAKQPEVAAKPAAKAEKKGMFGRLRALFAGIFH